MQIVMRQHSQQATAERVLYAAATKHYAVQVVLPDGGSAKPFAGVKETTPGTRLRVKWHDPRDPAKDAVPQLMPALELFLPADDPMLQRKDRPPVQHGPAEGQQEFDLHDGPSMAMELFAWAVVGELAGPGVSRDAVTQKPSPQKDDCAADLLAGLQHLITHHPALFWSMVLQFHAGPAEDRRALPPLWPKQQQMQRDDVCCTIFDRDWSAYTAKLAARHTTGQKYEKDRKAAAAAGKPAPAPPQLPDLTVPSHSVALVANTQVSLRGDQGEAQFRHCLVPYHANCTTTKDIPAWVRPFEEHFGGSLKHYLAEKCQIKAVPCMYTKRVERHQDAGGCALGANCQFNHARMMMGCANIASFMKQDAARYDATRAKLAGKDAEEEAAERVAELQHAVPCANFKCGVLKAEADMKRCTRCRNVFYCAPECQKAHWGAHKGHCRKEDAKAVHESAWVLVVPTDSCRRCYSVPIPAQGEHRLAALLALVGIKDTADPKNTTGSGGSFHSVPIARGEKAPHHKATSDLRLFYRGLPDECVDSARVALGKPNQFASSLASPMDKLVCITGAGVPIRGDAVVVRFSEAPKMRDAWKAAKAGETPSLPPLSDFSYDAYLSHWGVFALQQFAMVGEESKELLLREYGITYKAGEIYAKATCLPQNDHNVRLVTGKGDADMDEAAAQQLADERAKAEARKQRYGDPAAGTKQ